MLPARQVDGRTRRGKENREERRRAPGEIIGVVSCAWKQRPESWSQPRGTAKVFGKKTLEWLRTSSE